MKAPAAVNSKEQPGSRLTDSRGPSGHTAPAGLGRAAPAAGVPSPLLTLPSRLGRRHRGEIFPSAFPEVGGKIVPWLLEMVPISASLEQPPQSPGLLGMAALSQAPSPRQIRLLALSANPFAQAQACMPGGLSLIPCWSSPVVSAPSLTLGEAQSTHICY